MYYENKSLSNILFSTFLVITLTACGDSSSGVTGLEDPPVIDDSNTGTGGTNEPSITDNLTPITPLTSKREVSLSVEDKTVTFITEFGFEGNIEVVVVESSIDVDPEFQFANNISSLNVKDLKKKSVLTVECSNGEKFTETITYDYLTGVVVEKSTVPSEGDFSCTSRFDSLLQATLANNSSIADLLESWGTDTDLTKSSQTGLQETTCSQPENNNNANDSDNPNNPNNSCTLEELTNYTITDDLNEIHKISIKETMQVKLKKSK